MPVYLTTSSARRSAPSCDFWVTLSEGGADTDQTAGRRDIGDSLETAFSEIETTWYSIAKRITAERNGELTHTGSCAANVSDFGLMLAWARLITNWAREEITTLVVCDDPWMFRYLLSLEGVTGYRPPRLGRYEILLKLRGALARAKCAARLAATHLLLRTHRRTAQGSRSSLLVYGHPASRTDGTDGYFGDLMQQHTELQRILHVDCGLSHARILSSDGRTSSLHAWGNIIGALACITAYWRPSRALLRGPEGWLIRRAGILEQSTAQAAMIQWQLLCQRQWLKIIKPRTVAWPWESHAWERDFVEAARSVGTLTVGYQHSVVGRQMINYSPSSLRTGDLLPDRILCTGETTARHLVSLGIPEEQVAIGGALRYAQSATPRHDPDAPIFVALPFDNVIGQEMVSAVRHAANEHRRFVVKDHPMTPFEFDDTEFVRRTDKRLNELQKVSSVIYSATTVGLEALLMQLPTYRFLPSARIAINVLPQGLEAPTVSASNLATALENPVIPDHLERSAIFAPVDSTLWKEVLNLV